MDKKREEELLVIGSEYIKKAVEADEEKEYEEAFRLYLKGIDLLKTLLQRWSSAEEIQKRSLLLKKLNSYLDRVTAIKTIIGESKAEIKSADVNFKTCFHYEEVGWEDVHGMEEVKSLLLELIGIGGGERETSVERDVRSVLLYGLPGTGKTMLGNALGTFIANFVQREEGIETKEDGCSDQKELEEVEVQRMKQRTLSPAQVPFLKLSAFDLIVSKWKSPTKVKELFSYARDVGKGSSLGCCVLFIDDIDSIFIVGSDDDSVMLRIIKTHLLYELATLHQHEERVVVICASQRPWDLHLAALHKMALKVLVPMPSLQARRDIVEFQLRNSDGQSSDDEVLDWVAEHTNGFTGADVCCLIRDAMMLPVREIVTAKVFARCDVNGEMCVSGEFLTPFVESKGKEKSGDVCLVERDWKSIGDNLKLRRVSQVDVVTALTRVKSSMTSVDIDRITKFHSSYHCKDEEKEEGREKVVHED
eukprot:m.128511 g.128511  ORF g.128511 m.128511 type:complete len:476 (-) comp13030_c0_seq2:1324-2751(-)